VNRLEKHSVQENSINVPIRASRQLFVASILLASSVGIATAAERGVTGSSTAGNGAGNVTENRLRAANLEPGQWLTMGRDSDASFFSPLTQISANTVDRLGFAWQYKTNTKHGMEATPIVVDGVMYVSGVWGAVYALDGATGREIWSYAPSVNFAAARWSSTDISTRGVAVWRGIVYAIATDCQLAALDALTGKPVWTVQTLVQAAPGYTCSGAPQIAGKYVVVGNAGGENLQGGVRGYVSAFDLRTGQLAWRFYTVPSLADKSPSPELKRAAKTWDPNRDPAYGGGGTIWGLMTYDPELDLLYLGTGNAAPYSIQRDWTGTSRDRLYTASIIALHARTGQLAWYYQTTPGDIWDYDASLNIVLARLNIGGKARKVLLQANKNGYFYVLDRVTGQPLSIKPFAYMNWSTGIDANYRPIVNPAANYRSAPTVVFPSAAGAHSWAPMAYSPATGLAYIPSIETGMIMKDVKASPDSQLSDLEQSLGVTSIMPDNSLVYEDWEKIVGKLPRITTNPADAKKPLVRGLLRAWDPVAGRVVWEQQTSQDYLELDGGTLATAGGLVFAGRENGHFVVYDAKIGTVLKDIDTGSAIMAAPMTYSVHGRQYVSVLGGHGGSYFAFLGTAAMSYINEDRVLTFALDGGPTPKPVLREAPPAYREPPPRSGSPELIAAGRNLFTAHCGKCHSLGVPAISADLTRLSNDVPDFDVFAVIVLKGGLLPLGMPRLDDVLDSDDARAIYDYLIDQEWAAFNDQEASKRKSSR
jgi:quinohemoprotein ethanol dehydrogenase